VTSPHTPRSRSAARRAPSKIGVANFLAIDFETADYEPDSACAVGLVRVEQRRIAAREYRLIQPPRSHIVFTWLHGIAWKDVATKPIFADVWPELFPLFDGVDFLAAHNASFDERVLSTCAKAAGLSVPKIPFVCTMTLARSAWGIRPTKLSDVCRHLSIPLRHHEALSDAEACARIVLAAAKDGHPVNITMA
jgi:DNA polymerase-3 subunit epsilon